jgi:hypothetical protein
MVRNFASPNIDRLEAARTLAEELKSVSGKLASWQAGKLASWQAGRGFHFAALGLGMLRAESPFWICGNGVRGAVETRARQLASR